MNITFAPKQDLLQKVDYPYPLPLIIVMPTMSEKDADQCEHDVSRVGAMREMFTSYYGDRYTQDHSQLILVNMYHEPVRNAMEHGNKWNPNTIVVVGIWMGRKGILFAFRDEGDYFSREDIKNTYETRQRVKSTRVDDPGGEGCIHLYEAAEDIIVATEENTLYATYLLKDLE